MRPTEGRKHFLCALLMGLAMLGAWAAPLGAETAGASKNAAIYRYQGADREKLLVEKARGEGVAVVYTSMNLNDSVPLTEAFEKKYGVKVSLWRGSSEKVVQRAVAEARAGRYTADVFESNGPELEILYREKLLEEFYSPAFSALPPQAFPKHRQWVADRFNFFVLGYNTKLVAPSEVPNSYEDLLNPKWVGKLCVEANDVEWFAAVVKAMGEEKGVAYFRKLADMKPQLRSGHSLIVELVSAGEMPMAVTLYNHNIERSKRKGAPMEWKALQPAFGRPNAIGVARYAPHPHAALLFADFVLSTEGQEIIHKVGRVPASTAVDSPLNKFKYEMIDPAVVLDEADKWQKLWDGLFLKGRKFEKEQEK